MRKLWCVLALAFALVAPTVASANNVTVTPLAPGISGAAPHKLFYSYYNLSGDAYQGYPAAHKILFFDYIFAGDYANGANISQSPGYVLTIPYTFIGPAWNSNGHVISPQACPLGEGYHWWGHRMYFQVMWWQNDGVWGQPHTTVDSGGTWATC